MSNQLMNYHIHDGEPKEGEGIIEIADYYGEVLFEKDKRIAALEAENKALRDGIQSEIDKNIARANYFSGSMSSTAYLKCADELRALLETDIREEE